MSEKPRQTSPSVDKHLIGEMVRHDDACLGQGMARISGSCASEADPAGDSAGAVPACAQREPAAAPARAQNTFTMRLIAFTVEIPPLVNLITRLFSWQKCPGRVIILGATE